ncbi:P-loop containing nucleoside triphosphate hydrolase protein [Favolaschia claudopus]|uniref:small monomeric GTPase n=1 Tax=Favolaschia claudopus TaxID=2862362 RepID=A0AAW0D2I3_9AGAR
MTMHADDTPDVVADAWTIALAGAPRVGKTRFIWKENLENSSTEHRFSRKLTVDGQKTLVTLVDVYNQTSSRNRSPPLEKSSQGNDSTSAETLLRDADAFILMYTTTSPYSFQDIIAYVRAIRQAKASSSSSSSSTSTSTSTSTSSSSSTSSYSSSHSPTSSSALAFSPTLPSFHHRPRTSIDNTTNPLLALIANQTDRPLQDQEVPRASGEALAKELDCVFVEVSAKEGKGVEEVVERVVRILRVRGRERERGKERRGSAGGGIWGFLVGKR